MSLKIALLSILFAASSAQALTWKGLFIAGDHSIDNFDNGRVSLTQEFLKKGSLETLQLSSSAKFISQENNVYAATTQNIYAAFAALKKDPAQACLVHMTSHGAKGRGFYLSRAGILSPSALEDLLTDACGELPTVILVSACYSGQFITETMKKPNRIILTAARADRPSFGCSTDTEYTYWDECLLQELPKSKKWTELYTNTLSCISGKESALNVKPSDPQAYFGESTQDWDILH